MPLTRYSVFESFLSFFFSRQPLGSRALRDISPFEQAIRPVSGCYHSCSSFFIFSILVVPSTGARCLGFLPDRCPMALNSSSGSSSLTSSACSKEFIDVVESFSPLPLPLPLPQSPTSPLSSFVFSESRSDKFSSVYTANIALTCHRTRQRCAFYCCRRHWPKPRQQWIFFSISFFYSSALLLYLFSSSLRLGFVI